MTAHSFLPPSKASAWSQCALWPSMNARFPQDESASAREGTAAHWVAWEIVAMRAISEGTSTPNGLIVTGEMLDGGELVAETVEQCIRRGLQLHIEEPVAVAQISADCYGTPDLWAFDSAAGSYRDHRL